MGFTAVQTKPATYEAFPMWLRGPGLPDLLVENAEQARSAADRGYVLPSDVELEEAAEEFAASFASEDEDYEPQRYPLMLRHPEHRDAVPMAWSFLPGPTGRPEGRATPPVPEVFPGKVVNSPEEELEWSRRGWTVGSQFAHRTAAAHETPDPGATSSETDLVAPASTQAISGPVRRKLSGAARRKLQRERTAGAIT
jgi:hypothetical protein